MNEKKRTEISELGQFGLIDRLTADITPTAATTLKGAGDDAAVIAADKDDATLVSTDTLLEGVDFDLTYFPLKHLGYKAVTVAISDILAMNARPEQLLVSLGVSSKMSVEALDDLSARSPVFVKRSEICDDIVDFHPSLLVRILQNCFEQNGLAVTGVNPERDLVEIVEVSGHPWMVGVQFHPEFKSRPDRAHPLFREFIGAAVHRAEEAR